MIEITESGDVFYTNSRKERSTVGIVLSDGDTWIFSPVAGLHHKTQAHVRELLQEKFDGPSSVDRNADVDAEEAIGPAMSAIPEPAALGVDEEPAQEPSMGDKTPAWMAWFKRTRPEEFAARYAGRTVSTEGI
jgi:hypothetical protein